MAERREIRVYLSDDDKQTIQAAARLRGLADAAYLRMVGLEAARKAGDK